MGSVGSELASSAQLKQFEIGGFESFEVKLEPAVSDDVLWPEMTLFIPTWSETVSDNDSSNPLPNLVLISRLAGECGVSAEKSVAFLCFGSSGCLFLVRTGVREIEETRGGCRWGTVICGIQFEKWPISVVHIYFCFIFDECRVCL